MYENFYKIIQEDVETREKPQARFWKTWDSMGNDS